MCITCFFLDDLFLPSFHFMFLCHLLLTSYNYYSVYTSQFIFHKLIVLVINISSSQYLNHFFWLPFFLNGITYLWSGFVFQIFLFAVTLFTNHHLALCYIPAFLGTIFYYVWNFQKSVHINSFLLLQDLKMIGFLAVVISTPHGFGVYGFKSYLTH